MRRALAALLLTLPIAAGGSLAAHQTGFLLAAPDGRERADLLAATGHGYFAHAAILGLALMTVFIVGALLVVRAAAGGRDGYTPTRWCAAITPAAFVLQEATERIVHDGALPLDTFVAPEFLAGLALQAPFAVLAWAVARLVLRTVREAGTSLTVRPRIVVAPVAGRGWTVALPPVLITAVLARCAAGRAPPVLGS